MTLIWLAIFLGLLSVLNKILLLLGRKSGWASGMAIGLLSGFYFWAIGLKILAVAELGFFVVMLYGYLLHVSPSKKGMLHINLVMSALSVFLCYFLFTGYLTLVEAISSLSFIWGGYLLSSTQKELGWLLFVVAHAATSYASFHAEQHIFAALQVASAIICIYAAIKYAGLRTHTGPR
jgi:hypothetical protein